MGHARALLGLPIEHQDIAAAQVFAQGLTVRQTEALVRNHLKPSKKPAKKNKSADIALLEESLSDRLGTRVQLEDKNGKGRLVIEYKSLDILDGIIEHIK